MVVTNFSGLWQRLMSNDICAHEFFEITCFQLLALNVPNRIFFLPAKAGKLFSALLLY